MTDELAKAKGELANRVLESYKFEYQDYTTWWNDIERKAQGTVAIAGIILAGTFAFVRQLDSATPLLEKGLLAAIVVLLLASIALSVVALFVREFHLPPGADKIEEIAREILDAPDVENLHDRVVGITYDEAPLWRECTNGLYVACRSKAGFVARAQVSLLIAAILITVVTLREII